MTELPPNTDYVGPPRTLNVRVSGGWGDAFMLMGIIHLAKQTWPDCQVTYQMPKAQMPLAEGNPDIAAVIHTGEQPPPADLALAFPDDWGGVEWVKSQHHWMQFACNALGLPWEPETLRRCYYPTPDEIHWADDYMNAWPHPVTAFHNESGSGRITKLWSPGHWVELAAHITGTKVALGIGQLTGEGIQTLSGLSFRQSCAILAQCDTCVCVDSAFMHAAEAVNVPRIVCLYGATTPQQASLFTPAAVNLEPRKRWCDPGRCWGRGMCERPCIDEIPVGDVLRALDTPRTQEKLAFATVNWNCPELTCRLLEDITGTASHASSATMIVVDNGSPSDPTDIRDMLNNRFAGRHKFIANAKNLGYVIAANQALAASDAQVTVLFNPDMRLWEEGWDQKLLDWFRDHPRAGVVGLGLNERAYFFGETGLIAKSGGPMLCDWVNGSIMAIHRRCLDKVPWLDEAYSPGICDDSDYCVRAQALGFEVWWLPANVKHIGSQCVGLNNYKWQEHEQPNKDLFNGRWKNFRMPRTQDVPKTYP